MSDFFIRRYLQDNNVLSIDDSFVPTMDIKEGIEPFLTNKDPGLQIMLICDNNPVTAVSNLNINGFTDMAGFSNIADTGEKKWESMDNYYYVQNIERYSGLFSQIKECLCRFKDITGKSLQSWDSLIETITRMEEYKSPCRDILFLFNEFITELEAVQGPIATVKLFIYVPNSFYSEVLKNEFVPACIKYVLLSGESAAVLRYTPKEVWKTAIDKYITNVYLNPGPTNTFNQVLDNGNQSKNETSLNQSLYKEKPKERGRDAF